MDLSLRKLWEIVNGREAWYCSPKPGVTKSQTTEKLRNNNFPPNVLFLFQEGFEGQSVTAFFLSFSLVFLSFSIFP